jgi:hypothetical protein
LQTQKGLGIDILVKADSGTAVLDPNDLPGDWVFIGYTDHHMAGSSRRRVDLETFLTRQKNGFPACASRPARKIIF